ncbi:MAG: hypothetical protein HN341_08080, partial [Verrucomicrobia bacterium]|nr:hypothetical protein [Verrucomicrobiota bacterium]
MTTTSDSLFYDCYALLLAHLAMCDGGLHIREELLLKSWIGKRKGCRTTRKHVHLILQDEPGGPPLATVLASVPEQERQSAVLLTLALACVDGFCDISERSMVEYMCRSWGIRDDFIDTALLNAERSVDHQVVTNHSCTSPLTYALLSEVEGCLARRAKRTILTLESMSSGERVVDDQRWLFDSRKYRDALANIADVASSDLQISQRVLSGVLSKIDDCRQTVSQSLDALSCRMTLDGGSSSKRATQVNRSIADLKDSFGTEIVKHAHSLRHALVRRERTASKFTIVFAGKSKAGKSTLHSVIRGAGWNSIGVGAQRTTRVNRIYEWNGIRLIDTPGMGVQGAEQDKEKAVSVLGEADIVCFVLTEMNQQPEELEFLGEVRRAGKPVVVLLNILGDAHQEFVRNGLLSPSPEEHAARECEIREHTSRI